jgi:hypothetical protein
MTLRLGLDFDNTLVSYDRLFLKVALEKGLVPACTPARKNAVRDHLRAAGREEVWTQLQGEVYGTRILEAEPFEGLLPALKRLADHDVTVCIVSHKTRTPYLGDACDLHAAARNWLDSQGFHDTAVLAWPRTQVFFEVSREAKVGRVLAEGCTHFVDDLPEVLELLPASVEKIHFAPGEAPAAHSMWRVMRAWHELPALLGLS